jgi:hypothetical protein
MEDAINMLSEAKREELRKLARIKGISMNEVARLLMRKAFRDKLKEVGDTELAKGLFTVNPGLRKRMKGRYGGNRVLWQRLAEGGSAPRGERIRQGEINPLWRGTAAHHAHLAALPDPEEADRPEVRRGTRSDARRRRSPTLYTVRFRRRLPRSGRAASRGRSATFVSEAIGDCSPPVTEPR